MPFLFDAHKNCTLVHVTGRHLVLVCLAKVNSDLDDLLWADYVGSHVML